MKSFTPKDIPPHLYYRLLSGVISPRPVALVSSSNEKGNINLAPFSFFNIMSISPPILVFSPLRRMRTNTTKDTLNNINSINQVVINIIGYQHVEQMNLTGADYDSEISEFHKSGFTPIKSNLVKPPRVKEALASFECQVNNVIPLGDQGGAGNIVICEILTSHFKSEIIGESYQINPQNADFIGRLGSSYYTKVDRNSLFEIKKNSTQISMGWDNLPAQIINSPYLTGNEISKLASIPKIPITTHPSLFNNHPATYKKVKQLLKNNQVMAAWKLLYPQ